MSQNSKHHIEVSSVALVDLKAEISRRQIEIKQKARTLEDGCKVIKPDVPGSGHAKRSMWRKHNSQTEEEQKIHFEDVSRNNEDLEQLERSRRSLEAKAKLYEALKAAAMSGMKSYSSSRIGGEIDNEILVDFEQKAKERYSPDRSPSPTRSEYGESSCDNDGNYLAGRSDEEWEEYTDDRGNKRVCMRKDKPTLSSQTSPPQYDGPLTYAHLREGEIRDHGVGFYAFSKDAEEREAEMARLRELHRATEEGRARAQAIRAKRDARMGQRLARLRARKGLPDVATAAAQCLGEAGAPPTPLPVTADAQSDIRLSSDDLDVASMLRRLRDEAELRASLTNPAPPESTVQAAVSNAKTNLADVFASQNSKSNSDAKPREWDRGKSMISAERYIREEREKRNPDFAPPSFY
ncbi:unnamed protein product [Calicophoron daubneyi]|uniref:Coiled-coil domain-containing protein 174 n=1 Tax=Calicophoron daubneyi TaxID=300641 RepID=A0AAV2T047_CALDB